MNAPLQIIEELAAEPTRGTCRVCRSDLIPELYRYTFTDDDGDPIAVCPDCAHTPRTALVLLIIQVAMLEHGAGNHANAAQLLEIASRIRPVDPALAPASDAAMVTA